MFLWEKRKNMWSTGMNRHETTAPSYILSEWKNSWASAEPGSFLRQEAWTIFSDHPGFFLIQIIYFCYRSILY